MQGSRKIPPSLAVFGAFVVLLSVAYLPVLSTPYAHHDDYRFFYYGTESHEHPFFYYNVVMGRLGLAFIENAMQGMVRDIGDLLRLRVLAVILLAFFGALTVPVLSRRGFSRVEAFCVMLIILTLPPFEILVAYVSLSCVIPALLLAVAAARLAEKIPIEKSEGGQSRHRRAFLATVLVFFAFMTYQATATFYWVIAAMVFMFPSPDRPPEKKQRLVNLFVIGFAGMLAYFIYLLFLGNIYASQMQGAPYNPYVLTIDWRDKLSWFVREPLWNALNLWNIFPKAVPGLFVLLWVVLTGCLVLFRKTKGRPGTGLRRLPAAFLTTAVVLSALFVLAFLPNLLAVENVSFYRCCAGLTSLLVLVLVWTLRQWTAMVPTRGRKAVLTAVLILAAGYGMGRAYHNVLYYRVVPSRTELDFVTDAVKRSPIRTISSVHLLLPKKGELACRYDEFVTPTSFFMQDYKGLLNGVFIRLGRQNPGLFKGIEENTLDVRITTASPGPGVYGQTALVIDLRKLYAPDGPLNYLRRDFF